MSVSKACASANASTNRPVLGTETSDRAGSRSTDIASHSCAAYSPRSVAKRFLGARAQTASGSGWHGPGRRRGMVRERCDARCPEPHPSAAPAGAW